MHQCRVQRPTTTRGGPRLLAAGVVLLLVVAAFALGGRPAAAQMQFDFNEDGKVTCADFEEKFPDTFTDEATKALQQYPDDLSGLNNDPKEDDIACEGQAVSADPGDGPAARKNAKSTATSTPTPTATPAPAAPAAVPSNAPASNTTESTDIPADVMARVAGCAVIAISSRDVSAAGCPGVGAVAFRIPDDAPPMKGAVIMNPGANLPQAPAASPASRDGGSSTKSDEATTNTRTTQSSGKAGKGNKNKDDSTDTSKANKNKDKSSDNSKKNKDKNKKGKNGKNDKHGKKSKKHDKKGK